MFNFQECTCKCRENRCNTPSDRGCEGLNGIYYGYKGLHINNYDENETITYLFTPKEPYSDKFFKYMERNFKGQYYRVNEQEQDTMDDFTIDETLSYLNSKNNGHERKGNF